MKKFKEFLIGRESGRFLVNPYWLEYLLNLFFQEYICEFWEEMMDTQIENKKTIEQIAFGFIAGEFK